MFNKKKEVVNDFVKNLDQYKFEGDYKEIYSTLVKGDNSYVIVGITAYTASDRRNNIVIKSDQIDYIIDILKKAKGILVGSQ
jgi:hypothetical protein